MRFCAQRLAERAGTVAWPAGNAWAARALASPGTIAMALRPTPGAAADPLAALAAALRLMCLFEPA